jgi:DNA-binding CsgD family transcriptional regulator
MNFSNLASAYYDYGKSDSAEYFIKRSMVEHPKDYKDDGLMMVNYGVLGDIYRSRKDYEKSKYFYKKAETFVAKNANLPNIREIYNGLYKIYIIQDSADKAEKYRDKLNATELQFEKNKNKFLHTYIQKEAKQKNITIKILLILSVVLVIVFTIIIINYRRKSKILQQQEKVSELYFEEIKPTLGEQNLSQLIEMVRDNNPAFLAAFLEKLPGFSDKLLSLNPSTVQTEIEFCALLKLNIPTKEIAKYYNIEHRSVQNKKYRIRKKLNIPENMDIYVWFNQL